VLLEVVEVRQVEMVVLGYHLLLLVLLFREQVAEVVELMTALGLVILVERVERAVEVMEQIMEDLRLRLVEQILVLVAAPVEDWLAIRAVLEAKVW
jgi:hypothetical protein